MVDLDVCDLMCAKECNLGYIEARVLNPKACGVQGCSPHQFFLAKKTIHGQNVQNFKSVHNYMKGAECAETNEKSIFLLLLFLVS